MLADDRLLLSTQPSVAADAEVEVVLLGHCPGRHEPRALFEDDASVREIARLGFSLSLEALAAGDRSRLDGLPLPIRSLAQFRAIFPEASLVATRYQSLLAGARAWLPDSVEDFFCTTVPSRQRKVWVIVVEEGEASSRPGDAQRVFLPDASSNLLRPEELPAFNRALLIPNLGVIGLPDLERLQIPSQLPDLARVRLSNPTPAFLPCSLRLDDDHRERRYADELPRMPLPLPTQELLAPIVRALVKLRPDVQCLFTLPLTYAATHTAMVSSEATSWLAAQRLEDGSGIHHLQCLFPYLLAPGHRLVSPVGAVSGAIATSSATFGPWNSIAGRSLHTRSSVFPPLLRHDALALQQSPGVGILTSQRGTVELSDERLVAPVVGGGAFVSRRGQRAHWDDYRSGEVARFLGWIRRRLTRLGESWVFDVDPVDPRPRRTLQHFFTRLHALGALRGATPEAAFRIAARPGSENTVVYEVELAPAFPIDRIRINISHDRSGRSSLTMEV